jgi:hypothetical protein
MTDRREYIDYWIGDIEGGFAIYYRNADTEAAVAGGSQSRSIEDAQEWARENGCGEVKYEPGGPSDA